MKPEAECDVKDKQEDKQKPKTNKNVMMDIDEHISLDESELRFSFIHAGGPGGQNVNKVASAVQLRFDARASRALSPPVRARLERLAGSRATQDGVIIITARNHRSQTANRREALRRLTELIKRAAAAPRKRIPTRPGRAQKRRRLENKRRRAQIKHDRCRPEIE
jgi:ribosome-associated protein